MFAANTTPATPEPMQAYRRGVVLVLLGGVCMLTGEGSAISMHDMMWRLAVGETAGLLTLAGGALLLAAIAGDALTGIPARKSVATQRRDMTEISEESTGEIQ